MQFFTIIAILTTVVIAENAEKGTAVASTSIGGWIVAAVALLGLLGCQMFATAMSRQPSASERLSSYFRVWRMGYLGISWLGIVFVLHYCGWAFQLSDWSTTHSVLLLDELVLFVPAIFPLVVLWGAQFDVDLASSRGHREPFWQSLRERASYVSNHTRHHLLLIMAPLLLMLCLDDVLRFFVDESTMERWGWTLYGILVLGLVWLFPLLLRCVWRTTPLPDEGLRQRLQTVTAEGGLQVHAFLLWKTDYRMLNAAVTGFTRRFRYVLLTDGLLRHLSDEQIEAVVRHEAAHIQRGHMGLRLAALLLPMWVAVHLLLAFPEHPWTLAVSELGRWPMLVTTIAFSLYAVFMLGWISKQLEYDADLVACWSGEAVCEDRTWGFIGTLQRIADISGEDPRKRHWLHPSLSQRARFLKTALDHPRRAWKFRQRIQRTRVATWGLLAATACVIWGVGLGLAWTG